MDVNCILILLVCLFISEINIVQSKNDNYILSRRKRYLVFPEGSSLSVAICMTVQTTLPGQLFTEAINWGISYELPNDTSSFKDILQSKRVIQRRHRRDAYQKMEVIMNSMGFDGRACISRALCEATQKLKSSSIIDKILRVVFQFPLGQIMHSEPEEHRLYHRAHRIGQDGDRECSDIFPGCSFSLIDMAMGIYSNQFSNLPYGV